MASMMKVPTIGGLVLMAAMHGCTGSSGQSNAEISQPGGSDELQQCDAIPVQRWVGRKITATTEAVILKDSGADVTRLIRPGEAITMDYQTDRINLELDQRGYLARIYCG